MSSHFNIVNLFFKAAEKYPDRAAIVYRDKQILFSEFALQVKETGNFFRKKGITKGDRVLVFVPMCPDLYRIVIALFEIGATVVFLDEWVNKWRMEECCKVADCSAFIGVFKARLLRLFSSELRKIPLSLGVNNKHVSGNYPSVETDPTDTALITFTTGSTGVPKAAKRTHGFLSEQFNA